MNEAFKRILDDGIAKIEAADKAAREAAVQAKRDMRTVAELAESLPRTFLDPLAALTTTEFSWGSDQLPWHFYGSPELSIGGQRRALEGAPKGPLKGRYRAIVILQKIE